MLSYRHSYHAGNFADVLKHIILIEALEHICKKSTPFDYIDSHAGAGLYSLTSEHAKKIQEYKNGIAKINFEQFPELELYKNTMRFFNQGDGLKYYPGSPAIAKKYLRSKDHAWLYEMHPSDFETLGTLAQHNRNIRIEKSDGFKGVIAKTPPLSKRGIVFIDPSYEIKSDYELVFSVIEKAYKKFSTGMYILWYPVIDRGLIKALEKKFIQSEIKKIQLFELGLKPDNSDKGMTSAGIIIINPPWTLMDKMKRLLPKLASCLGDNKKGVFRHLELVGEK